jgi:GNAT superfamily N-acetyltransferase
MCERIKSTLWRRLRIFFRSNVLAECRVWVAESPSHQYSGLVALSGSWIRQLAVFPPFQRQGVGSALLQKAREHSPGQLHLYTFQRNMAARAFYEHHGFSIVRLGVSPAPEAEPAIEFRWQAAHSSDCSKVRTDRKQFAA